MYRNYTQNRHCGCNNCMLKEEIVEERPMMENKFDDTCKDVPNSMGNSYNECECGFDEEGSLFPDNPMFGQSYVPWQTMGRTFVPEVGLRMGTIFPELVSPYYPGQSLDEMEYLKATNKIGEGCNA